MMEAFRPPFGICFVQTVQLIIANLGGALSQQMACGINQGPKSLPGGAG